jgi:hypothetical protein
MAGQLSRADLTATLTTLIETVAALKTEISALREQMAAVTASATPEDRQAKIDLAIKMLADQWSKSQTINLSAVSRAVGIHEATLRRDPRIRQAKLHVAAQQELLRRRSAVFSGDAADDE